MTFTSKTAKEAGKRSGEARRGQKMDMGDLETVSDAKRRLKLLGEWAVEGRIPGAIASAAVRSCEVFLRAIESDHSAELIQLREQVKEMEGKIKAQKVRLVR